MLKELCKSLFLSHKAVLWISLGTATLISSASALPTDQLIRQITKNPANDYHVKWSPDGKMLAFASLRSGEPKIWLIPADGGEAALLETGLSGDHHISWAPDGKRITFDARWDGRPNIFTISLADGRTKRLSPDGTVDFQPYWSPDGSRIAFASLRSGNADIWLMPADGGPATQLTHDEASDHHPVWSPDGKTIAFSSTRAGNTDIWVKDVKENFPFLKGPYLGQKLPGISPESFAANIPELHFLHGMIRFSPDGQEAYWRTANAQQISVSKIEKGQWTRPKAASFSVEGQADDSPVFSPNGKRLFFISSRAVTDGEQTRKERIWVIERIPEGWSEPRPLPDIINSTKGIGWQFSVDSHSNLYFGVRSRVGIGDIYCAKYVNGQYNQPEKMRPEINAAGAYNHSPYIYPDGRTLLFSRDYQRGPAHIHVSFLRKDGTWTEAQILNKDWKLSGLPAVTADGKYLFFIGDCGSSLTCWVDASFIEDLRKKAPIDSN
jgi:Tol biopolymer transport system component